MIGFVREQKKKITRSSGWNKVRKQHLKVNPRCACCTKKRNRQVHHIKDFSTRPELELEVTNLITLCGRCHLFLGHLGYWKSINPEVIRDTVYFRIKIINRRQ
jgi:5-methylcytosine-specific restriction endonuclease McrA